MKTPFCRLHLGRWHGPAGARRYDYVPTYILRGLVRLNQEFTPAA